MLPIDLPGIGEGHAADEGAIHEDRDLGGSIHHADGVRVGSPLGEGEGDGVVLQVGGAGGLLVVGLDVDPQVTAVGVEEQTRLAGGGVGVPVRLVVGRVGLGRADENSALGLALALQHVQRELIRAHDGGGGVDLGEDVGLEVQVPAGGFLHLDIAVSDGVGVVDEEIWHQGGADVDVLLVFLKVLLKDENEVTVTVGGEGHKGESSRHEAQSQQEGEQLLDHRGNLLFLYPRCPAGWFYCIISHAFCQ